MSATRILRLLVLACLAAVVGCRNRLAPATLDREHEACSFCRMMISDGHFAAQVVAPREDPRFFDDLGCLRAYLRSRVPNPRQVAVFVADHRTGAWVPAARAVYVRRPDLETPMSSHMIAHSDLASQQADDAARGAVAVPASELLGPIAGVGVP